MITRRRFLEGCGACGLGVALLPGFPVRMARAAAGADIEQWSRSVCDLCGLAEPVFLGSRGDRIVAAKGIAASTHGFGRLCPRARALTAAAATADRAHQPLVRRDPASAGSLDGLEPASWEEAMAFVAERLHAVRSQLGPAGLAFLVSDGETCETYDLVTRLARGGLGTDHVDTPARLDALGAFDACRDVFGVPASPSSTEDVDAAELVILIGGEIAESHPGLYYRVLDARRAGRCRVVVIDSRKTLAAGVADLHLRPLPGRELAAVNALAAGLEIAPEAETWRRWLRSADAGAALREARLDDSGIRALADAWNGAGRVMTLVGPVALGHPAGPALARAVAQLHQATGRWGKIGQGVLFLPRGANATGVEALGIRPGALPAGGRLSDPADREAAAAAWSLDPATLPSAPGLPLSQWPAAVASGALGALVVHRVNAAAELPGAAAWREALTSAFVVATTTHVPTETTVFADVVLPVAMVAGESSGTFMTPDRRCQLLERAVPPPGEARTADRILRDLAGAVLDGDAVERLFPAAESGWDRWRAAARGTVFEAGGIPFSRLREELDVAWPCPTREEPGSIRLAPLPGFVPRHAPTPHPASPGPDGEFPLLLVTGPLGEHTRSRVRTGRTPELHYDAPTARLEMHPADGAALGMADGDWITVVSASGSATASLWLTDRVMPGTVFLPEHYGFLSDLQGGSLAQQEPEALAQLLTSGAASGAAVAVRPARRRDLRQRGI